MTRRPRRLLSAYALLLLSLQSPCHYHLHLCSSSEAPCYALCSSCAYIGTALLPPRAPGRYLCRRVKHGHPAARHYHDILRVSHEWGHSVRSPTFNPR
ncbi:hypothetical protein C8Q70DRAFT_978890 [Cubamyces menziesii]|nr:hypothetical protein C8Q70DRAFT_978890 [Cubamyces menziesii]